MAARETVAARAFAALVFFAAVPRGAAADDASTTASPERRIAILVAANEGGEGTRPLRYADRDARRMADVLTRLGGFAAADVRVLAGEGAGSHGANVPALLRALDEADADAGGGPSILLVYFSGHAKEGDLRLGTTRLAMSALKDRLARSPARVKIAVLDACRSGELTRAKGGYAGPEFDVQAGPNAPEGLALLSSSSADEDSQESDAIGGSFFTHYLASGMLGDADASGDGRVTLQEAYAYAYGRTVAETADSAVAAQHPSFAYDLRGSGEVWLTDVGGARAAVVFPAPLAGAYLLVDARRRTLAGEVTKEAGAPRRIALPPGSYEVKRREGDRVLTSRFTLGDDDVYTVDEERMVAVRLDANAPKGAAAWRATIDASPARWVVGPFFGLQSFLAPSIQKDFFPAMPVVGFEVAVRDWISHTAVARADFTLGSAPQRIDLGAGLVVDANVGQLNMGASSAWYLADWPANLRPYAGFRLALIGMSRSFTDPQLPEQRLFTLAPGGILGLEWEPFPWLAADLRSRTSYLLYSADGDLSMFFVDLVASVQWVLP